jgi:hypothetical protein
LPGPALESPLAHLDDEALIRRYCAALSTATTDEDAAGELWHHRHGPILLQKIKYLAAKPGQIRPDFIDFQPFVEASWGWAWQKYHGGIRLLQNPGSKQAVLAWLEEVAYSSCMTEQRKILTRGTIRPVPLDEVAGQEDVPKEADRQPSAEILIAGKQRKFIARELLILHGESSERARESAHFVRLYHWRGWKCPQIARHYYADPVDEMQKKADDHRVWNRLQNDHVKLRKLLKKVFNVASLRQI